MDTAPHCATADRARDYDLDMLVPEAAWLLVGLHGRQRHHPWAEMPNQEPVPHPDSSSGFATWPGWA